MTTQPICVSAPANVMLMGEHAVLFGHRAIVCAVSQRIHVTLTPRPDKQITIQSALGSYTGTLQDIATMPNPKLAFVCASIGVTQPKHGFDLDIHSEFSHTVGLGSSAAVTAACVYALLLYKNGKAALHDVFDMGLQAIHTVQQRGSGSDLAASVFGGMLGYTMQPKSTTPLLANAVHTSDYPILNLYYCGYKTPTPKVLATVAQAAQQFPALYQSIYGNMHATTTTAEAAIKQQNWQQLGQLINIYHGLMDALGVSDAKLSELVYSTRNNPDILGAKISGSGLGDCIITLSKPNTNTAAHTTSKAHNSAHISAHISPQGLLRHD